MAPWTIEHSVFADDSYVKNNESVTRGCPCGVMVKAMDCGIVVSEFELQSRYYGHFRARERYELPYPLSYGLNSTTTVLIGE